MNYNGMFSDDVASFFRSPVREIFKRVDLNSIYSFAGGYPSAETFPMEEIRSTMSEVIDKYAGKAFQYGFFALMACVILYGVLESVGLHWCDTLTGCTVCICIGLGVFAVSCILNDAYLSLKEKPGKVMVTLAVIAALNLSIGAVHLTDGGLVEDGLLTIRAVNPICGVMVLVILAVYGANYLLGQREEAE